DRLRGPVGAGDTSWGREVAAVHQGPGGLRGRPPGRPELDPGREGDGGHGRTVQRVARGHPKGRGPGPPAPHQYQLPGSGRRADDGEPDPAADRRDSRTRSAQVRPSRGRAGGTLNGVRPRSNTRAWEIVSLESVAISITLPEFDDATR